MYDTDKTHGHLRTQGNDRATGISQLFRMFCHSAIIHSLGFFICFIILDILNTASRNNNMHTDRQTDAI